MKKIKQKKEFLNMEENSTTKLFDEAYKNVRMASYAIDCIIDKIDDVRLEDLLRKQNDFYLDTTEELENIAKEMNHKPQDINIFLKGMSNMGINMKTMFNTETSHIAEMLVQGTTMGITEIIKANSEYPTDNEKLRKTIQSITQNEELFVESLKNFL